MEQTVEIMRNPATGNCILTTFKSLNDSVSNIGLCMMMFVGPLSSTSSDADRLHPQLTATSERIRCSRTNPHLLYKHIATN